jgi:hypothetical protein
MGVTICSIKEIDSAAAIMWASLLDSDCEVTRQDLVSLGKSQASHGYAVWERTSWEFVTGTIEAVV